MQPNFSVRNIYGDHMVFQRNLPIRVVGTAPAQTFVTVRFAGETQGVFANEDHCWEAVFSPMEAGGPYALSAMSGVGSEIVFRDIFIGEVWFCSGQSNMEFPVSGPEFLTLLNGAELAKNTHDDRLRFFLVQKAIGPDGICDDLPGGCCWKTATSEDAVAPFSAVAYWFGMFLRQKFGDIHVGMISSSWGGTSIEPWIPEFAYEEADREKELVQIRAARDAEERMAFMERIQSEFQAWVARFFESDPEMTQQALREWAKPGIDLSEWTQQTGLSGFTALAREGVAWYRCEVDIPIEWAGQRITLHISAVDDCDETFFDGVKIGETSYNVPNCWAFARNYAVPAPLATPGRHVIAIRDINYTLSGGILGKVWLVCNADTQCIDLSDGVWGERLEFAANLGKIGIAPPSPTVCVNPRESFQTPTMLYNAMVHPFTAFPIRGFIWYQGCSNAADPADYRNLQPMLIESWRRAWGLPDAPFLITQLTAFERHDPIHRLPDDFWKVLEPKDDSGFVHLREVQDEMRSISNVGVAVTIDIGDHSDIHPHNKKDVAWRLFRQAERLAYGETGIVEGPHYVTKQVDGDKIRLSFTHIGKGLVAKGGAIGEHSFAIAGADGHYVWADAKIDGDTIVVWSPNVPTPVNVRYAWASYPPNPNLYNVEGFPMAPFRTDRGTM